MIKAVKRPSKGHNRAIIASKGYYIVVGMHYGPLPKAILCSLVAQGQQSHTKAIMRARMRHDMGGPRVDCVVREPNMAFGGGP